ncbi:Bsp6I family type II restriction endonuclease [Anaerococcus sp. AGMB09787]|uniref:Bsp6I family type II restriction endonuclease n=1 Tax=Anaerococcus sp. AGMB09787 TaxID=2922869 RepID=UPI001FAE7B79|nr:Bsp6I family type II restriction endonuclease [Anaerococcus sp. AGMB09787]
MKTRRIDEDYWETTKKAYLAWVKLNDALNKIKSRKANFPSGISEAVVGYVYDYEIIEKGAGDLYDPTNDRIIEVKASANYNRDLTSFSPSEFYDDLIFVRYNQDNMTFDIYDLKRSRDAIDDIPVSTTETYKDHRSQGRRPRFSIIDQIIEKENLKPDKIFSIDTGSIDL